VLSQGVEFLTDREQPAALRGEVLRGTALSGTALRGAASKGLWLKALLLGVPLACAGFIALILALGWLTRPDLSKFPPAHSPGEVAAAERARNVRFDVPLEPESGSALPRIEKPVDPELAYDAPWWPKGEAPVLQQLVAQGKLPPVLERVGPQPLVLDGGSIGNYGGTWLRAAISAYDVYTVEFRLGYPSLFRWSPLGYPIVPHLAVRVDQSEDRREFVVHLRPGVRWSDGVPFGADDILFWWRYEATNPKVSLFGGAAPMWIRAGKGATRFEKVDDLTFRISFDEPFGDFLEMMAANSYFMARYPKHYAEKYHPDTADPAFLAREMKAFGLSSPFSLWQRIIRYDNPDCPRLWPWVPRTWSETTPFVYVRNPYYFAVDPEGNQLPYIDRVQFDVKTQQMLPLTFSNGEVTMQGRHISYENYTELMSRREEAHYQLLHWYPASRSDWIINPNLNRYVDPADPATAKKARLLADKRFRQALSLALDRKAIIRARFDDTVRPSQIEPGPESPFHSERLAHSFVEHDPARANALLDELGLRGRDVDGMRTFEDGGSMTFYLTFNAKPGIGPAEFVVDDWRDVGLRVIVREQSRLLFQEKRESSDYDLVIWTSEDDFFPLINPRSFAPPDIEAFQAAAWGRWFSRGGFFDSPESHAAKNSYGPAPDSPMYSAYRALVEARALPTLPERVARFREALDIAADNVWTINIAEPTPFLVVVNDDLRNVPKNALYSNATRTPGNAGIETYYFAHPSHAADAATRAALESPTPMPRVEQAAVSNAGGQRTSQLIRWGLWGSLVLFLALLALRHPFVARRIASLVPTLVVISVVVFASIQLPPGDFLSSRILELSEAGDANAVSQIEELRRNFHFDEPVWKRYLRWTGAEWFVTRQEEDRGLLQGFLGRSMETLQPVNDLVGDRLVLTIVISVATILFTWALAIPIGIYSAVRQYSFGDYFFSVLGFLGMSVPPFLLALVLMVLAGVSGLFSPAFAAQADWTWPKVIDLLKHFWIPVVVMGWSGMAGLSRVMRANLLDELRKPYVMTARARGVRPLRLLLKYPVRVALNPFVSGMGQLLPQLISGGAIVGIVLSLPIIGPLQVEALVSADTYLAGSMLMVLSLLSVFGTLIADLVLLWLDPRIRYDKEAA
jgi:ABC-type dipeptide/oligopeptide/nickel transport system permease component/ABC-type transport system substrate-binding protein